MSPKTSLFYLHLLDVIYVRRGTYVHVHCEEKGTEFVMTTFFGAWREEREREKDLFGSCSDEDLFGS